MPNHRIGSIRFSLLAFDSFDDFSVFSASGAASSFAPGLVAECDLDDSDSSLAFFFSFCSTITSALSLSDILTDFDTMEKLIFLSNNDSLSDTILESLAYFTSFKVDDAWNRLLQ